MDIRIRQEVPEDFSRVYRVVEEAFRDMPLADHDEQDLVVLLRESSVFIPELSLVALAEGVLVGHPAYYPRFSYLRASTFGITLPIDRGPRRSLYGLRTPGKRPGERTGSAGISRSLWPREIAEKTNMIFL